MVPQTVFFFFEKGINHLKEELKKASKWNRKSTLKCGCGSLILIYPIILVGYAGLSVALTKEKDKSDYLTYAGVCHTAAVYFLQYLDDFEKFFLSTFEVKGKSRAGYLRDPICKELVLNGFKVTTLVFQFQNGKKHKLTLIFGILAVILHLGAHAALILGKETEKPKSTVNGFTETHRSELSREVAS